MPLAPNSATLANPATVVYTAGLMGAVLPRIELPDGRKIDTPHPEWFSHQLRWRWLLDSWEGGEVYRMAVYGFDVKGMPIRNMIRHKREYPSPDDGNWGLMGRPPGTDPANQATDDDYELRRRARRFPAFSPRSSIGTWARSTRRRSSGKAPRPSWSGGKMSMAGAPRWTSG